MTSANVQSPDYLAHKVLRMQGVFLSRNFKKVSKIQMVAELFALTLEVGHAGESLQQKGVFLQEKAG